MQQLISYMTPGAGIVNSCLTSLFTVCLATCNQNELRSHTLYNRLI